jgi:hypothetical protein
MRGTAFCIRYTSKRHAATVVETPENILDMDQSLGTGVQRRGARLIPIN